MSDPRLLRVPSGCAGERLDAYLARELDVTRGYARRLLARGRVALRDRPARKGTLLSGGERVEVGAFRHPREGLLPAPELELRVLAADGGWVAIDKPAGLPTHPLDFDERRTAANAFLARFPEAAEVGAGGLEPGLVHRLDTFTSGVLLFATHPTAWAAARSAFAEQRASKRYLARVHGRMEGEHELRLQLASRGQRMRVVARDGLPTCTRVRSLEPGASSSLVEVDLVTGARHQIRVSLAHLGHPVLGDRIYRPPPEVRSADPGPDVPLDRHLLHAWSLRIQEFGAVAPVPPIFGWRGDAT